MKKRNILLGLVLSILSCNNQPEMTQTIQGKVERDEIAVVGKVPGRIDRLLVREGDHVKRGDTLAVLDIPEVDAKKAQAKGAVTSAEAQYEMAVRGATANQLKQLNAKKAALTEQYEFARKSLNRLKDLVKDSLIPQQQYDEVFAKYQGAKAQMEAVDAEIADVKNGVRIEQQMMARGQQDRALGALKEVQAAEKERYILAPQNMQVATITLKLGELALPGYTLFKGVLDSSTYFRFTIPESKLSSFQKGKEVLVNVPYLGKELKGIVRQIKPIGAYANIATAYPDYDLQDPLYEMLIRPQDPAATINILSKSTVTIKK
ncbi:HlyD family secretion protein [Arachidicoccus terrestris]|uniref:HlyD family secretion protein n=1 Tax=Arachidicoccus terrestris TaxID=2875539 RepID=UPI001CC68A30|nr:biotin/lipoyl-binding protein [Arachidicoccus terrestris]UAY55013.1 biotin/lipoyl-binding protein [Arachidicoccus terrestris]